MPGINPNGITVAKDGWFLWQFQQTGKCPCGEPTLNTFSHFPTLCWLSPRSLSLNSFRCEQVNFFSLKNFFSWSSLLWFQHRSSTATAVIELLLWHGFDSWPGTSICCGYSLKKNFFFSWFVGSGEPDYLQNEGDFMRSWKANSSVLSYSLLIGVRALQLRIQWTAEWGVSTNSDRSCILIFQPGCTVFFFLVCVCVCVSVCLCVCVCVCLELYPWHMEVPRLGVESELQLRPLSQPQQCQIQATSSTYTMAHENTGSLTHWVRPGIKPVSSRVLVRFITTEPQQELFISHYLRLLLKSSLLCLNTFIGSHHKRLKNTLHKPWSGGYSLSTSFLFQFYRLCWVLWIHQTHSSPRAFARGPSTLPGILFFLLLMDGLPKPGSQLFSILPPFQRWPSPITKSKSFLYRNQFLVFVVVVVQDKESMRVSGLPLHQSWGRTEKCQWPAPGLFFCWEHRDAHGNIIPQAACYQVRQSIHRPWFSWE